MRSGFVITAFLFALVPVNQILAKEFGYCSEAPPLTFNPQHATDGATFNASSRTIYNRLVDFERGGTKVVPSLAEAWDVSADGREITFKLRKSVSFHTTEDFTPSRFLNADDVLFTFNRMRDKTHPYHNVGGNYPSFQAQQMDRIIADIQKVDELTVKFLLSRPEAPFLANLAMDFASILSKEYADQLLAKNKKMNIDTNPVGTGPFTLLNYVKDKRIEYDAHPRYFAGPPKISKLTFHILTSPSARLEALQSGKCHLISAPSPRDLDTIRKDKDLRLVSQPGLNVSYLALNIEKTPFSNVKVRRAIAHAVNRSRYVEVVFGGNAQVAKNPVPPIMWSYHRGAKDYAYSPEKAKELLKEAGLEGGFKAELWYAKVARPYMPDSERMAELIQMDLSKVGIKVALKGLEWKDFLERSRKGEPVMSLQGWTSDNGDPDNFLNNLLSCDSIASGNNRARWCHRRYSFLVDRARVTTNIRTRTKFYEEAQEIFKQEAPWVTLATATVFKAMRKNVKGYRISPFGVDYFGDVDFEKAGKE